GGWDFGVGWVLWGRRADGVWGRCCRSPSHDWGLCGAHSQGREAWRPAGPAVHKSPIGPQSQSCQNARHQGAANRTGRRGRGDRMRRREFIALISGAATWPLAAQAQEPGRIYRLGFLIPSPRQAPATIAFFDALRRNGFIEGQNLAVIPDGFDADYGHLPELATALVKAAPDVITAGPARALQALQSVTHAIPLNGMSEDMVAEGLVASLA